MSVSMNKAQKEKLLKEFAALRELAEPTSDGSLPTENVTIIPKKKLPKNARKTGRKFGKDNHLEEYVVGSERALNRYFGIHGKKEASFIAWKPRRGE